MLRLIAGVRRRPSETWVEYMQRSTWRSKELAAKYELTDWCDLLRKRKQQMVQKVRTMQSDRWPARILKWTPWFRTNTTRSEGNFCVFVFKFFSSFLCAGLPCRFCAKCAWVFLVWTHPTNLSLSPRRLSQYQLHGSKGGVAPHGARTERCEKERLGRTYECGAVM